MAPEAVSPVEAREVVRSYVAAMQENSAFQGQDLLAEFRLIRQAAQSLGEFGDILAESGLLAALETYGLAGLEQSSPEAAVLGLTAAWVEENGALEAAVARSALAACLQNLFAPGALPTLRMNGASLVKSFLATVLCRRLAFDLGESLEAAATGWGTYQEALARLEDELAASISQVPEDPPGPTKWAGLAGWLYVTRILENLLHGYQVARPSP